MSCHLALLNSNFVKESISVHENFQENELFFLLPLELFSRIFYLLDFQSYTTCCLVSKGWKKLLVEDLQSKKIFKIAYLLLMCPNQDLQDQMEKQEEDQPEDNKSLIQKINFIIPMLRVHAKITDACLNTLGFSFDHLSTANDLFSYHNKTKCSLNIFGMINFNLSTNASFCGTSLGTQALASMIFLGVRSQIQLNRLKIGNWNLNTIRKRLNVLQIHSKTFGQTEINDLYKQIFFEFERLNEHEKSVEFFEDIFPHVQNNEKLLLESAEQVVKNLCLAGKYDQASTFVKKYFKRVDQIEGLSIIIVLHAIKAKHFDLAKNRVLDFSKKGIWRSVLFINLIKMVYEDEPQKLKQMVKDNNEIIGDSLLWYITFVGEAHQQCDDLFKDAFEILSKCLLGEDSDFKKLHDYIDQKLEQANNEIINKALFWLLRQNPTGQLPEVLKEILIARCTVLEESTLSQALCSPSSIVSDKVALELIAKIDSINQSQTFKGWQRSEAVENCLVKKINLNQLSRDRSLWVNSLSDHLLIKLINNFDFSTWELGSWAFELIRRPQNLMATLLNKCSAVEAVFLEKALQDLSDDRLLLQMIEKLNINSRCVVEDFNPFSYNRSLDTGETYRYLKNLTKNRNPKIQRALQDKYSSQGLIM